MSHVGKIYERILERRLRIYMEEMLSEAQCGFRPGRGTVDQISALRIFLEKSWEYGIDQHICFLDLEKAFDRVPREKMWKVIRESGIPQDLLNAIRSTYDKQMSTIIGSKEHFAVTTGVRQGSVLSPLLFITYLDRVMREVSLPEQSESFAYADDIAQTACSKDQLEDIMRKWTEAFTKYGLKLSISKTEYMMVSRNPTKQNLELFDAELAFTDNFIYLGSKIGSDNTMESEINNRISKFSKNVGFLYPLLREKNIPRTVKTDLYTSILRPILTYGCETWTLTEKLKSKIQAAEMKVLRMIFGVTMWDRKRNVDIRKALGVKPIVLLVEQNILRWYGHVMRMSPTRTVKRMVDWRPHGKRPRGRPRKRWQDGVKEILERMDTNLAEAEMLCHDRKQWRSLIHRLSTDRLT